VDGPPQTHTSPRASFRDASVPPLKRPRVSFLEANESLEGVGDNSSGSRGDRPPSAVAAVEAIAAAAAVVAAAEAVAAAATAAAVVEAAAVAAAAVIAAAVLEATAPPAVAAATASVAAAGSSSGSNSSSRSGSGSSNSRSGCSASSSTNDGGRAGIGTSDEDMLLEAGKKLVRSAGWQEGVPDMWFVSERKPSFAQVKAQLDALRRRNTPGSEDKAKASMQKAQAKALAAGKRQQASPEQSSPSPAVADYASLVVDGQGCEVWRGRLQRGDAVPEPFLVGGAVGLNPAFSLSAVREWLQLRQVGHLPANRPLQVDVADEPQPAPDGVQEARSFILETAGFFAALRPKDAPTDENPAWIDRLLDGDMAEAKGFWC
jgi:hypothetical protein